MHRYLQPLLERINNGDIDPSELITHRIGVDEIPNAYKMFNDKKEDCVKVVIQPA